jgi:FkbM family methyltransferase
MNNGDFAQVMADKYGCSVFGIEANPILASENSGLKGVVCKNAAISARDGFVKFSINEDHSEASGIVPDATPISKTVIVVPSMSLATLMREAGAEQVDLLKIDVEGAELDVFETTDPEIFRRCAQIAVEFHAFMYPSHAERIEKIVALLSRLGFHCADFSINRSDVLFINSNRIDVSAAGKALLALQKYQALILRRLFRMARHGR